MSTVSDRQYYEHITICHVTDLNRETPFKKCNQLMISYFK